MGAATTERLPRDFTWLWAGFGSSNLADGVLLAAGPLLVASITRDPFAVAAATLAQRLPWVVFGLAAGLVVDQVDRRRLLVLTNAARALVLVALVAAVVTDRLSLPVVYATMVLLGTAETFADNAGPTLVATSVPDRLLGRANARLVGTGTITNRLAGPPLGALLFGLGVATPFAANAALLGLAAVCVGRISTDGRAGRTGDTPRLPVRQRVAEGWAWLSGNAPVRRLTIVVALFNLTFGATSAILVLYALEQLGLDDVGFGLLLTASAVGGLVGAALFPRLEARFSYGALLRAGVVIETCTHLVLASTTTWLVAGAVLVVFGVHEAVWGSLSTTIRLRAVPEQLLGRVNSIYLLGVFAPLVVGSLLGGVVAARYGIVTVFVLAGIGAGLTTAWAWPGLADLGRFEPTTDEDDDPTAAAGPEVTSGR